jgi:cytochrome c-type biogenesis protein CcmH/NrfG
MGDWIGAEADLTAALAARPRDLEALVLRAEARIQRSRVSEAELDVNAALQIDPRNVEVLVMRGRVREARRLGRAPD